MIVPDLQPRIYDYLGGITRGLGGILVEIGWIADHVHILVILKPTTLLSDFMRELKSSSSKWAREITGGKFEWQNGYGAFTVGKSQIPTVRKYIQNQERHHRSNTFEDEFKELLRLADVEYDERYLWR